MRGLRPPSPARRAAAGSTLLLLAAAFAEGKAGAGDPALLAPTPGSPVWSYAVLPEDSPAGEEPYRLRALAGGPCCGEKVARIRWEVRRPAPSGETPAEEDPSAGVFSTPEVTIPLASDASIATRYRPARPGAFFLGLRQTCDAHPDSTRSSFAKVHQFRVAFRRSAEGDGLWFHINWSQRGSESMDLDVTGPPGGILSNVFLGSRQLPRPGGPRGWQGHGTVDFPIHARQPDFEPISVPLDPSDPPDEEGLVRRTISVEARPSQGSLFVRDCEIRVIAGGRPGERAWEQVAPPAAADRLRGTVAVLSDVQIPEIRRPPAPSSPVPAREAPPEASAGSSAARILEILREWEPIAKETRRIFRLRVNVHPADPALTEEDSPISRVYFLALSDDPAQRRYPGASVEEVEDVPIPFAPLRATRLPGVPTETSTGFEVSAEIGFEGLLYHSYYFLAAFEPRSLAAIARAFPPGVNPNRHNNHRLDGFERIHLPHPTRSRSDPPPAIPALRVELRAGSPSFACDEPRILVLRFPVLPGLRGLFDPKSLEWTIRHEGKERVEARWRPNPGGPCTIETSRGYEVHGDRGGWIGLATEAFDERNRALLELCLPSGTYEVKASGRLEIPAGPHRADVPFESSWTRFDVRAPDGEEAKALEYLGARLPDPVPALRLGGIPTDTLLGLLEVAPRSRAASVARALLWGRVTPATKPSGLELMRRIADRWGGSPSDRAGPEAIGELAGALGRAVRVGDKGVVEVLLPRLVEAGRAGLARLRELGEDGWGTLLLREFDEKAIAPLLGVDPDSPDWPAAMERALADAERAFESGSGEARFLDSLHSLSEVQLLASAIRTRRLVEGR
ncbi:MAG: hypothetical protein L0323_01710 [Planctomycetes bacterium]|nr:hypothetical protein [Planctomycetota bacterium]